MIDLVEDECFDMKRFKMPVQVLFVYFSYVCYKKLGREENLCSVLDLSSDLYNMDNSIECYSENLHPILLFEVSEQLRQWMVFYCTYNICMLLKMQAIESIVDTTNILFSKSQRIFSPGCRQLNICSCNVMIDTILDVYISSLPHPSVHYSVQNEINEEIEVKIARHAKSTADRMYYVQVLMFNKKYEKAISILNSITEGEGDYSLSVFICPKEFWESNFLDDNLRKELSKSSADYVVFPTNLYARYLLVNAYNSLGQTDQCERNKTEFRILRQRYSSVEAFAPMLNIVSNIFN